MGAIALAAGCAVPPTLSSGSPGSGPSGGGAAEPALRVAPVYRIDQPAGTPAGQYAMGRIDLGLGRTDAAIERFRQALVLEPDHVDALNGLAIAYGRQGRFDEAIAVLERAIARESAGAHLFNNLGYLQMQAGRLDEAWQALKRAFGLDPRDTRTRENLRLLVQARQAAAPGVALSPPSIGPDWPLADTRPGRPLAETASGRPPVETAPGRPLAETAPGAGLSARLEVSNGVGLTGLARRTARHLAGRGLPSTRLTDARGFGRQHTELHYRAPFLHDAQLIQRSLPIEVRLVSSPHLHPRIDVRLVVGKDLTAFAMSEELRLSATTRGNPAL